MTKYILGVLLSVAGMVQLRAQSSSDESYWILGVGYNFVDDSGPRLNDYFNFDEIWHAVPYPSRVSAGYVLSNGLGFHAIGSYNRYQIGKIVDGEINQEERDYWAFDGNLTYELKRLFNGRRGWFDPYVTSGGGFTRVGDVNRPTFNGGGGINFWLSEVVGLNIQSMGKWALNNEGTNHLQHAAGVVFRLDGSLQKEASEEASGHSYAGIIEPVKDSVPETVTPEEIPTPEETQVAEAAPEVPSKTPEELRREAMLKDFEALGKVTYAFNSSYLKKPDEVIVDELVTFLKTYPEAIITVEGHADSRGKATYNLWLSERRANRIVTYVVARGIPADQIIGKGFGEEQLKNHCKDGVYCTEEEHRVNRRVSYSLKEK